MIADGKFNPVCQLSLEVAPDASGQARNITLPPNITIDFEINREALSSTQTASFSIKNLDAATRELIFKDQYDYTAQRAIQFRAGYGTTMPLIFNGTILSAYSGHDSGATEDSTDIEAFDGGFAMTNGFTSGWGTPGQAVPSGTPASDVIAQLAGSLPGLTGQPIIGSFPTANMRREVLFGNTWGLIQQKSNGLAVIDDSRLKALNTGDAIVNGRVMSINDVITDDIMLIDADTGLLGAPRRSGTMVTWEMIFEPRFSLFQAVNIQSKINPRFNGIYRINGFTHRGTISPAVEGMPRRTTANFYFGKGVLS